MSEKPVAFIRGIYATALTKLLTDEGFTVAQPSPVIAERFGLGEIPHRVHVEVRDKDDRQGVIVSGCESQAQKLAHVLLARLPDPILRKQAPSGIEGDGRLILEVEFPGGSKQTLDELRSREVPTIPGHHQFRTFASEELDQAEVQLMRHPDKRDELTWELKNKLVYSHYGLGKVLQLDHVKPQGEVIHLSEGVIVDFDASNAVLVLKRSRFTGRGMYDGLNIPKAEGDYALTVVAEGSWVLRHSYFSHWNSLKGEYYSVNTPIEFYPDRIRYVDLEIDVVQWADKRVAVIDQYDLERAKAEGYLSAKVAAQAKDAAFCLERHLTKGLSTAKRS